MLAVVLCAPHGSEGLRGWFLRLQDDQDEVGPDWGAARGRVAVLALDASDPLRHELFGGDRSVQQAVAKWSQGRGSSGSPAA